MQKLLRFHFLLLLLIYPLFPVHAQKIWSPAEIRQDLLQVKRLLETYYPGIYHYEDTSSFHARLEHLSPQDSLGILGAYQRITALVAGVKDLHLSVGLPAKLLENEPRFLPLVLRKFGDNFYVHLNASRDSTYIRGTRVHSLNGIPLLEDYRRFQNLYGADNDNPYSKSYYAEKNFGGYYARWYGFVDSTRILYTLPGQDQESEKPLVFQSAKENSAVLAKRYKGFLRKNFDYKIIDSTSRTSLLDITSFRSPKRRLLFSENKYKKDLKRKFKQIQSDSTTHLILDLRGNGGGAVVNVQRLLSYLLEKPFHLYDSVSITRAGFRKEFKPYLGLTGLAGRMYLNKKNENAYFRSYSSQKRRIKPNKKYRYSGELYVLMDGGSYSATTFTISLLKNQERGIFVGTPPGGADWGSFAGRVYSTKLKQTKLKINIPLMTLVHNTEGKNRDSFVVLPDYHVEQNLEDFINRRDTVLEFVKSTIRNEGN